MATHQCRVLGVRIRQLVLNERSVDLVRLVFQNFLGALLLTVELRLKTLEGGVVRGRAVAAGAEDELLEVRDALLQAFVLRDQSERLS